jgi:hypothetical protein
MAVRRLAVAQREIDRSQIQVSTGRWLPFIVLAQIFRQDSAAA